MLSTVIVKTDRETDGSSAALYFTFLTKRSFSTRILAWIPPEVFKECPSFLFFPLTVWSVSRFLHRDHWNWDQVLRFLEKKLLRRPRPGCSGYFVEGDWVEKMPIYKQCNVINRRHVEETLHHNTSHGEDRICTNDQKTQWDRGTGFQHHQLRSRFHNPNLRHCSSVGGTWALRLLASREIGELRPTEQSPAPHSVFMRQTPLISTSHHYTCSLFDGSFKTLKDEMHKTL